MALKAGRVGVNPNYVDKEGRPLYDNAYLKELLRKEGIITLFTKEGNPISIDNAVAGRVYDLVVNMTPKQAGTGTPSHTNVRTISGYSSITITLNGSDIEITFDSTVYGGVYNPITGSGTIIYGVTDLDSLTWHYDEAGFFVSDTYISGMKKSGFIQGEKYVNVASNVQSVATTTDSITSNNNYNIWCNTGDDQTTPTGYAYYDLAEAVTIQLTAQDIQLLTGSNTVSSDTGTTMDLKYLGTLVPGGANGRSLNRSLNLNREVIDSEARKEIQDEIKEEVKEVSVEEPVTVKKLSKKSTK